MPLKIVLGIFVFIRNYAQPIFFYYFFFFKTNLHQSAFNYNILQKKKKKKYINSTDIDKKIVVKNSIG